MSPMTMNYATEEGYVTPRLISHYVERARGGVGLIILEGTFFTQPGKGYVKQLGITGDKHIDGLKLLTHSIHDLNNATRVFLQIHHAGWRASSKITGQQPVGPSAIAPYPGAETARELSILEIEQIVEDHIQAAARAGKADFDGIDIHCAHGYLIPSFLSPVSNKRNDEYGGGFEGRTKILFEIISGIKQVLGSAFPVTIKISGDEYIKGGLHIDETARIINKMQKAGLNGVTVSAGTVGGEKPDSLLNPHRALRTLPMMTEPGCLVSLAHELKSRVDIPVAAVGRINHPELAERILSQGQADLVAMGRALLADPQLPNKAMQGNEKTIRPCIACNEGCYKQIFKQAEIKCAINPLVGRESEGKLEKVDKPKKVVIIGAGPAGLEAAHAAWKRGHKVVVIEKEDSPGGQLNLAAIPPGRGDIHRFIQFLIERRQTTDVELITGVQATERLIGSHCAEEVIDATGAQPSSLHIDGIDSVSAVDAWEIIRNIGSYRPPFLVVGGGLVGCEAADCISSKGYQVSLIEVLEEIASDGDGDTKTYFTLRFKENGIPVYRGASIKKIEKSMAQVEFENTSIQLPVETLVIAVGARSNNHLYEDLNAAGFNVKRVGDCVAPRRIIDAVHEGFNLGKNL